MLSARWTSWIFWTLTLALLAGAVAMAAWYAPVEETMGPVQKIFYLHLPVAIDMFIACAAVCAGSIGYIWQRGRAWDALADAAAGVVVIFSTIVLVTGVIWAHSAWGRWWTWSPRLTFSLVLWILYIAYMVLRRSVPAGPRRALVSAVYGIVAFLDVPLVYLSVKLIPDIHPSDVQLDPAMRHTLLVWFLPVTLIGVGLAIGRYRRVMGSVAVPGNTTPPPRGAAQLQ